MRVLHLDAGREMRGGQRQLRMLLRGLAERGIDQELLARGPLAAAESAARLTPLAVRRRAREADLIHAHDARSHTLAAIVCPGVPLAVSRRVAFPPRRGVASAWKYARVDLYLAVSEHVAQQLREAGIDSRRIRVVYDGVELPDRPPELPAASGSPRAGVLDVDDSLKLIELACESCRLAGVEAFVDARLDRVLDNSDFLLYLTASEGLGSALLAAAAHGRPAIASRVGGVPEVVVHEKTGLLVENRTDDVAGAIKRFAENRTLLRACGAAAFERARAQFSDDMMVSRTLEAYRELLKSKP